MTIPDAPSHAPRAPDVTTDPPAAVVFDVGGVLVELGGVDTFMSWVGQRMTLQEVWRRWLTSPAVRAFERGRITPEAFAGELIAEFELPLASDALLEAFEAWPRGPFPGAVDLVRRAGERALCATLSNSNVLHWDRILDMGFRDACAWHFPSHLVGKLKPDRDVFEHVVEVLGCAASAVLLIDDQPLNVAAARAAGLRAEQVSGPDEAERVLVAAGVLGAQSELW